MPKESGRTHYVRNLHGGAEGEAEARQFVNDALAEAETKAARKRAWNKDAHNAALHTFQAIVGSAVDLRRKAHRSLTDEEKQSLVADVPEQFKATALELVGKVDAGEGARLDSDRLARERAADFAQTAGPSFKAPADENEESTADILARIER